VQQLCASAQGLSSQCLQREDCDASLATQVAAHLLNMVFDELEESGYIKDKERLLKVVQVCLWLCLVHHLCDIFFLQTHRIV
jgi:hypothetical protein